MIPQKSACLCALLMKPVLLAISAYTFVFLYNLLKYKGVEFKVKHTRHLDLKRRVHPFRGAQNPIK